jgi:hypothetical protein
MLKLLVFSTFLTSSIAFVDQETEDYKRIVKDYIDVNVSPWIESDVIVAAIKEQNLRHQSLSASDIAALDAEWRTEIGKPEKPLISKVLATPLSKYLSERQALSGHAISEIIVFDAKGLNVGISEITSDMFQGDEEKYQKTFLLGKDREVVGDLEKDASTQAVQSTVSKTIVDEKGIPIGAIAIGVSLDGLL